MSHASCTDAAPEGAALVRPSLPALFLGFLKLGLTAFGGPGMIPYIRRYAVENKGWIDEKRFKTGVGLSQAIPGATAMQVAAYVGIVARGLPGGLAAYVGFGLPAFALITTLSAFYADAHALAGLNAIFAGLKVIVVAIIASAAVDCSQRYAQNHTDKLLALAAALWLGFGQNPILAIVAIMAGSAASSLVIKSSAGAAAAAGAQDGGRGGRRPSRRYWLGLGGLVLLLAAGLLTLRAAGGAYFDLAVLMLRVDLFAFGGGYVSVPFMLHEVVEARHWLSLSAFMDGIAFGQITPGPIVMTAAFVGYLLAGFPAAIVATVYVFAPSFLLLAGSAAFVERVLGARAVQRALHGALATLVGLLAATAARFALATDWRAEAAFLALATFAALRVGVGLMWVVLGGSGLAWLLLR